MEVGPGVHSVVLRQPVVLVPIYELGSLEVEVQSGDTSYVRYSHEFSEVAGGLYPIGTSRINQVSEDIGRNRQ